MNISFSQILFLAVVALLIFGDLPSIIKKVTKNVKAVQQETKSSDEDKKSGKR